MLFVTCDNSYHCCIANVTSLINLRITFFSSLLSSLLFFSFV